MRTRIRGGRWVLVLSLVGVAAAAQELENAVEPVPVEYRPTLAVLEVVASDLASIERAQQLETELLAMLALSEQFQPVSSPAQVKEQVGGELQVNCTELECFEAARARLQVQRVARLTVEQHEAVTRVTLLGLDPMLHELTRVDVESEERAERFRGLHRRTPAQRDLAFLRKVVPRLRGAFGALATPRGKLIVDNRDPGLTVLVDGRPVGSGRYEEIRERGTLLVSIENSFYEPFDRVVTVEPGKEVTVDLRLVARPVLPVVVKKPAYSGLMSRPGTYLALSGVTILGVGLGLGLSTSGVKARVAQGGYPVPVTRSEAMGASSNAVLANLLMGTGVALSAWGITWVALTPSVPTNSRVDEPTEPGAAWTLSTGGTF